MLQANRAKVEWNAVRKHWEVHILVGAETIKRPIQTPSSGAGEADLKQLAVAIARDEGYDLVPEHVEVDATRVQA